MKLGYTGMGSLAALLLLALASGTALAAPPPNDTIAGATPAWLGFIETINTSEATTDRDDAELNADCGAPATDASVWYVVQGTGDWLVVDVSHARYTSGVLVGMGSPGNLHTVACGQRSVAFFAAADTTYYVLVIDDQYDGGGNGGDVTVSFEAIPPPPTLDISVDPFGTVNIHTGVATISGTYTCTNAIDLSAYVEAYQDVGRFRISGFGPFYYYGTCDGTPHAWSADVLPQNGKFAGGKALTVTLAYACGRFQCSTGYQTRTVQLRGGPR